MSRAADLESFRPHLSPLTLHGASELHVTSQSMDSTKPTGQTWLAGKKKSMTLSQLETPHGSFGEFPLPLIHPQVPCPPHFGRCWRKGPPR